VIKAKRRQETDPLGRLRVNHDHAADVRSPLLPESDQPVSGTFSVASSYQSAKGHLLVRHGLAR